MRSAWVAPLALLVLTALAVSGTPQERASAASSRCRDKAAIVRLENGWVTVLTVSSASGLDFYACYRRDVPAGTERVDPLITADLDMYGFLPPALAVSSRTVAFGLDARPPEGEGSDRFTNVVVERYFRESENGRHAGWYPVQVTRAGRSEESKIGSIVVRPNGAVAWISCPMKGEPSFSSGPTCVRAGHYDAVFRTRSKDLDFDNGARELLDRGRGINPRSLRRYGDRIYWTKNGRLRSAALE